METINLIGDVHGKIDKYLAIVSRLSEPSLQVGDMGLGDAFFAPPRGANLPRLNGHRFLRGNHDSPQLCREHANYAGDFGMDRSTGMFWIGGAFSVDRQRRLASGSWWPDEELSEEQWTHLLGEYERFKPEFVVSHECPSSINHLMLSSIDPQKIRERSTEAFSRGIDAYIEEKRGCSRSRTCIRMDQLLELHRPRRWIFGHYHMSWEANLGGTQFVCLAELQLRQFEL